MVRPVRLEVMSKVGMSQRDINETPQEISEIRRQTNKGVMGE